MILNGKQIAQSVKDEILAVFSALEKKPRLDIIYAGNNPAIESFMKIKLRAGEEVGAETVIHRFPESISQDELLEEIRKVAADKNSDGMIIQLPLPVGMNTKEILNAVPVERDVDMLSEKAFELFAEKKTTLVPPVARAIMEILKRQNINVSGKAVAVLGRGILVGKPTTICLEREGAHIIGLNSTTGDPTPFLLKSDIIITGIGKAHYIKPEMLKDGAVLIDAGTSEKDGKVAGDADPACAEKCSLFTPVPCGVGPIMIAMLFKNLSELLSVQND